MSLTRKLLKGMSLTDEQVDSIIENHTETVTSIKEELDALKTENEDLKKQVKDTKKIQKELDDLKQSVGDDGENPFEKKYKDERKAFEDYKKDVEAKEKARTDKEDYKKLIIKAGIPEAKAERTLKTYDPSEIKRDKDGNIENESDIIKKIKEEWSDLIQTKTTQGADTAKPPAGDKDSSATGGTLSKATSLVRQRRANLYGEVKKKEE